jgi:ABC-type phosphate transport system permease subunit
VRFLEDILTPPQRKKFYALFGLLGVLLGAVVAGFAAAAVALPVAVKVALGVYAFLGGAFGATANANTPPETHRIAP